MNRNIKKRSSVTFYWMVILLSLSLLTLNLAGCDNSNSGIPNDTPVADTDTTAPILSEVSAVITPARTYTPTYTFNSDEAGTITYGGDCSSADTSANIGDNTIIFNPLSDGTHSNCTITVTDAAGLTSTALTVNTFVSDTLPPTVTQVTAVTTPARTLTPSYTFNTTEAGTITYGGDCSSADTSANIGDNTIIFNPLSDGTHSNCTITVTDAAGLTSTALTVNTFVSDTLPPTVTQVTAVTTPARTLTPSYTFNTTEAGTITYGGDCSSSSSNAVIGDNTVTFNTLANGEYSSCTIQVKDAANNASQALPVSPFTVAWINKPLNDTGQVNCGDYSFIDATVGYQVISASGTHNNDLDCTALTPPVTQSTDSAQVDGDMVRAGQDAVYGRDATNNDDTDGHAGFSFTKLNASGVVLADQTKAWNAAGSEGASDQWSCVQDNGTGLTWEVKQQPGNGPFEGLHDANDTYNWYNTDATNNGGTVGYADDDFGICTGYNFGVDTTFCNTQAFVTRVNAATLCGYADWRLPTKDELASIVANDRGSPAIDTVYFPNIPNTVSRFYWSASPFARPGNSDSAWIVDFFDGRDSANPKSGNFYVRLIRNSQSL